MKLIVCVSRLLFLSNFSFILLLLATAAHGSTSAIRSGLLLYTYKIISCVLIDCHCQPRHVFTLIIIIITVFILIIFFATKIIACPIWSTQLRATHIRTTNASESTCAICATTTAYGDGVCAAAGTLSATATTCIIQKQNDTFER